MMNENKLTSLEIYINRVFKLLIIILPSIALCAGLTFTVLHLLGYYPAVEISTMVIFDITCVIYTIIGIIFSRRYESENGSIKPEVIKTAKVFVALLECVQWNFISYMIPSRDFWAYSFFFVILTAFFLDSKFVLIVTVEIAVSMVVSWIIRPAFLLPIKNGLFVPEMVLRCVVLVLGFTAIYLLTLTVEHRLVKEIEKISNFDVLTLLYNRRKLDKYLDDAIEQRKTGAKFSVIMSDIDDFKKVNDTFGHSCGDAILRNVAGIMHDAMENKGPVFRYGGEEILAIVYAGEEEAASLAEEIRKKVEDHCTLYEGNTIKITLTFGVAEFSENDTSETLIKRADTNLYYGKNHGKNCVIK